MIAVPEEEDVHGWHFRYNRRLACFSNSISACMCSPDGAWLVSGTGSGDVKVWDTTCWAEVARLKGFRSQEPRAIAFSPAQRWLVCAYSEAIYVFEAGGSWKLHHAMPALMNDITKTVSKWACAAFSQHQEVNHAVGTTGNDTHLGALSDTHLHVLDYSGGWKLNMPSRSRSLMSSSRPVSMTYTCDGAWLICGFEAGQMQIWNASSLLLEKTMTAHNDTVTGIISSPTGASYDPRVVSCSKDQTLRLWHPVVGSWLLEQHVYEPKSGRQGVRSLSFASDGMWLASVAMELCIWRLEVDNFRGTVTLELHQYVEAVGGSEGLRNAVFSGASGVVAGSRDGVLGLWTKAEGRPQMKSPDESPDNSPKYKMRSGLGFASTEGVGAGPSAKPIQRLSPLGVRPMRPLQQLADSWSSAVTSTPSMPLNLSSPLPRQSRRPNTGVGMAATGLLAVGRPGSGVGRTASLPQLGSPAPQSPFPQVPQSPFSPSVPHCSLRDEGTLPSRSATSPGLSFGSLDTSACPSSPKIGRAHV